jgi:hypothetical protein
VDARNKWCSRTLSSHFLTSLAPKGKSLRSSGSSGQQGENLLEALVG